MRTRFSITTFTLVLLLSLNTASAQQPTPSPTPDAAPNEGLCTDFKTKKSIDSIISCAQAINDHLQWHGIKPSFGGVVPGSGFGGGVGYSFLDRTEKDDGNSSTVWQTHFDADAIFTIRKYWQITGALNLLKTKSRFTPRFGDNLEINVYGQVKDMQRLDYFGIGPETDRRDLAEYHLRESVIGADIATPVSGWLDIGGAVEGIWPRLTTITDPTVRSVNAAYNDATAPGLLSDPSYIRVAGYLSLHTGGEPEQRRLAYDFFYNVFNDVSDSALSFRRFDADLKHKFRLGDKSEIRFRARLSSADTSPGQRVPFYLLETLGGSNIRNDDTLRGFGDYRFRDQSYALFQTDFMTELHGPLKLIVFYDTGKVAPSFSRLDEGRLRHTYGAGIVVIPRQLDKILFRFYVALGSGEGSHTFFGLGDSIMGGSNKLLR
ncbi:MAG TPA: hypothetical protein VHQ94_07850 [Pyrinomonadaceae bacterium]|jgi:hypothetical protein|nr:hypothetical protein [Pyrinomonadaceae bacterium]